MGAVVGGTPPQRASAPAERLDGRRWFARTAVALARDVAIAPVIAARDRVRDGLAPPGPPPPMGVLHEVRTRDGATLVVRVAGSRRPGAPTFVLTHGLCGDHGIWGPLVPRLAAVGRVVTWDLRGHGSSTLVGRQPLTTELAPQVHAADLLRVVAAVAGSGPAGAAALAPHGPLVLAGHSLGGLVLLLALRDSPALRAATTGAAVLGTPTGDVVHSVVGAGGVSAPEAATVRALLQWLIGDPLAHYAALHDRGAAWLGYAIIRAGGFGSDPDPVQVRALRDAIVRTPPAVRRAALQAMASVDLRGTLGEVTVPTLVAIGDRDRLVNPRLSRALARELPDAELLELPDAGHALVLERHALISARLLALANRHVEVPGLADDR